MVRADSRAVDTSSPPDTAPSPDAARSSILQMRLRAAAELGWTATCLDPETRWLWQLRKGGRTRVLVAGVSAVNDAAAARLASDKFFTATVLRANGFSAPTSARCLAPGVHLLPDGHDRFSAQRGLAPGLAFAEREGLPVVVKPNRGSRGRDVILVERLEQLPTALEQVWAQDELALVQRALPGLDLRVDLLDGELLLAYLRRPLRLVGDGRSTVLELLTAADARASAPEFCERLRKDPLWRATLAAAALDDASIPAADLRLDFPATILNLNRCCTAEVHGELPAKWIALCRRIAALIGLRHCGIDLRVPLSDDPLAGDPAEAVVLEVNASPSMGQIHAMGAAALASAAERRVTAAILDASLG
ncbi:hypothetical protein G6O69_36555 [Pseudenhygromyxa sp. WMMC2535]|uniref:ATP-grasp domain-containing protein n=1 Tax=Pseudenhygromyxa sp. WMMC2535 TaxID=2712867 RepID=UPI001552BB86|nr:hypothetical protein [Pseudenhygromyxa sp. WMMC2535]NVB36194.1 hypothetical protein [Pseudenhygromyxa sp. WMMC2535]NVB43394.1 hypothetical protein [Pseudenhygromyxa sp. WMMC2535]